MDANPVVCPSRVDGVALHPPTHAASPGRGWLAVMSVAICAFAFVATEYLPVGLLPQIARDLGVTPGTAGLMVTTPGVIAALSAPALLLAAGRINRRLILLMLSVLLLASNIVAAGAQFRDHARGPGAPWREPRRVLDRRARRIRQARA